MLTCDYWLHSIWVSVQFETLGTKERIELDHVIDKGLNRFVCLVAQGGRRSCALKIFGKMSRIRSS